MQVNPEEVSNEKNSTDDSQHMLVCEARTWLRRGYCTPEKVYDLKEMLLRKRSQEAIEQLIQEMRNQWRIRHQWLEVVDG